MERCQHASHVLCRQLAMLVSLVQSNPDLVQRMGRAYQQVLIEVQRMEKLAELKVHLLCFH